MSKMFSSIQISMHSCWTYSSSWCGLSIETTEDLEVYVMIISKSTRVRLEFCSKASCINSAGSGCPVRTASSQELRQRYWQRSIPRLILPYPGEAIDAVYVT